jgi:hypothetical protein
LELSEFSTASNRIDLKKTPINNYYSIVCIVCKVSIGLQSIGMASTNVSVVVGSLLVEKRRFAQCLPFVIIIRPTFIRFIVMDRRPINMHCLPTTIPITLQSCATTQLNVSLQSQV